MRVTRGARRPNSRLHSDFSLATDFVALPHLYLFSTDGVYLCLLSNGKFVDHYIWASGEGDLEIITILLNLRDTPDVFDLLDDFIRET